MKRVVGAVLALFCVSAVGQTSETIPFRAVLSPANENPPIDINASGAATVWLHIVRDAQGEVVSGSADFDVTFQFPGEATITGLHIHRGVVGENGPVTIDSGIRAGNTVAVDSSGRGRIQLQGQATTAAALDTIRGMLQNPAGYYVNLHTSVNPGGVIRGQTLLADMTVVMGIMSPRNENPPIDSPATGIASLVALITRDAAGNVTSGRVTFDVIYSGLPGDTMLTGLHVHTGVVGMNGPVTIDTGLRPTPVGAGGAGTLQFDVEVPIGTAASLAALEGLFASPPGYYVNLHTTQSPGGLIRAQMRSTDRLVFPVSLLPSNEVPPIPGLEARAESTATIHTIRENNGAVIGGVTIFDVNPRFPGETSFTGLHIHNGAAGENGPVTIDSGIRGAEPVVSDTGSMNIFRITTVSTAAGIATLNSLVANPERHYLNLHTSVNAGGAVRSQLARAITAAPVISFVVNSASAPGANAAPGGLITAQGANLTKISGSLSGFSRESAPTSLNGVQMSVGGRNAPLIFTAPNYIVAQVPFETLPGIRAVTVTTPNGTSAAANITVAASAPAIFFDTVGGVAVKNSDFGLIRPDNPAAPNEIVVVYLTGLGATSPALESGQVPSSVPGLPGVLRLYSVPGVTATVGGRPAEVIYALASPGFLGLYQVALRIPGGLTAGNQPLVLTAGGVQSNSVNIAVR